jgi:hypothetical protein
MFRNYDSSFQVKKVKLAADKLQKPCRIFLIAVTWQKNNDHDDPGVCSCELTMKLIKIVNYHLLFPNKFLI